MKAEDPVCHQRLLPGPPLHGEAAEQREAAARHRLGAHGGEEGAEGGEVL